MCLAVRVPMQQANQQPLRKSGFLGGINRFHQRSVELGQHVDDIHAYRQLMANAGDVAHGYSRATKRRISNLWRGLTDLQYGAAA